MTGRAFLFLSLALMLAFSAVSCRRDQKTQAQATAEPGSPASVRPAAAPAVDPKVTAAVGKMHQAERTWREQSPEAAAAFKRLTDAQTAYQGMIDKFGLYTGPVREREARMSELMAARETNDAEKSAQAEKAYHAANAAVDAAEANLRLGNPQIQALYDEWVAAREGYAALRNSEETISKASEEVSQLMGAPKTSVESGKDGVKE
ncbi:MAG: hypothetical protein R6X19_03750 [Kiritimatiellia bacterium]